VAEKYISDRDTLERLARLEVEVQKDRELRQVQCESILSNIKLAKEVAREAETLARKQVDKHFDIVNNFQSRIERAEGLYATKEDVLSKTTALKESLETKIDGINKYVGETKDALDLSINRLSVLVYVGVGLVLAFEFVFKFIIR
jgi:hypothetical protein